MKVVFEITGLSCDLALHPISPQTAESMREGGRDIYSQKYMNWWRRGNTRTFGMRINESSEIRLQVDGEDVSFNANLLYRNVYTVNMPGVAFGHQVNSGREAANAVLEYLDR